ncbi:UNVERIFIED_CONTAM: hypothetical protein PYX00_000345 [Menopon gallinae]|uniref:ABC transporter domain-containing protein n=1 Tax=Menopon gallinae TaxID=328185 RepID=A0AAW2I8W7_9NEOP
MNETFRRLLLLMWKNWLMQRRRRMKMVVDIFIPLFIAAFLLFVRYQVEVTTYESITSYKPFSVDYIPQFPMMNPALFKMKNISLSGSETSSDRILRDALLPENILDAIIIPRAILVSSPDTEPVGDLMTKVCTKLGAFCIRAENSEELEKIMTVRNDKLPRPRDILLAGVAFPEVSSKIETSLDQVRIRFPAELRFPYRKGIGGVPRNWVTGLTFPMFQVPGPRDAGADKGGIPGYYEEGFLGIQNAISSSLLETRLGSSETNPLPKLNITLKRYPYPSYDIDPLLVVMQNILPFLFVVSFLFSLNTIVEKITTEKERRLKVVMKIMGLSDSLRWTSWFIYSFLFLGLLVTILLIVLKVEFFYDRAVFPHSDWSCLAVFLFTYACATITFAFLISSLLQKASVASIVSGMAWFLMYMPFYIIQRKYAEINTTVKCLTSLFLNTGMGIGFQIILMFESAGVGSQWDNFAKSASPDDGMSMLLVIAMMWLDCLIYLCLALYIENVFPGKYGTPLPYYYPFQRSYWSNKETKNTSRADENLNSLENVDYPLEEPPKGLNAGVQIKNLRKVYGKKNKPAVKNLCFNAYEGQITALLGFNGAGKTTTLSILTGIYPPTSGTAVVAGYDIRTNMKDVRRNLGFCPQYNVLFDELTVKEHLKFFGSLRGLNEAEVKEDTEKYLNLLKLKDKKNTLAKYLSGGMKRKLSVTLAMCGNTKVLIFDEPTAGMDPRARRSLWDLLKGAKKGRTIIITTHHLDEADLLGDRVAIMSEGKLDCHGSTFFLKQHYSCGYHLIIVKKDNCDVQKVTDLVRKHIPEEIKPEDVGMELSYQLDKKYLNRFEKLFSAIEREKVALKITNFGVTHTSLEDVFKSIADGAKRQTETEIKEVPLNERKRDHDVTVNVPESEKLSGFPLLRNRVLAMFYKYIKSSLRSWKSYLMLLVMTVAGVGTGIFTIRVNNSLLDLPPRTMDLQNFPNPIVSVQATESCKGICRKYFEAYRDAMLKDNVKVVSLNSSVDIDEYLLGECDKDIFNYRGKNVLATTFSVDSEDRVQITGSFNGVPYHLPPTALSYIYNAIFKTAVDPQAGLTIINEPLPYKEETKVNIQGTILNTGFQVAIFVCFTYVFVASYFIVFPVIERGIKAKHLQFVSGVGIITFWSTCYLWNFLMSLGPNITLLIALAAFQEDGFKEADELGKIFHR